LRVRILVAALIAGFAVAGTNPPQPAEAHAVCVFKNDGATQIGKSCNRTSVFSDGNPHWVHWTDGCDMVADGYSIRSRVLLNGGTGEFPGTWDANGATSGCANDLWGGQYLYAQRACAEVLGCGGWLYH